MDPENFWGRGPALQYSGMPFTEMVTAVVHTADFQACDGSCVRQKLLKAWRAEWDKADIELVFASTELFLRWPAKVFDCLQRVCDFCA